MAIYVLVDGAPAINGRPRQSMAINGKPRQSMALHGTAWHSMAIHGNPWHSMALNGTPWQIYDELLGNLRPSEISSMALTFSMETIVDGNRWQSMAINSAHVLDGDRELRAESRNQLLVGPVER